MRAFAKHLLLAAALLIGQRCRSQVFINLNFEAAVVSHPSGLNNYVYASNAIPGWTAYINQSPQDIIGYDTVSLGGAAIFLQDSNAPSGGGPIPLQGRYGVLLEGSTAGAQTSAAIGQTGQVPLGARSVTFFLSLDSNLQLTFNGQPVPLVQIGTTPNYDVMGGDISAFAGQTGQLLFTAPPNVGYGLLDNIVFSDQSIPEPSVFALAALGGVGLFIRRRK